MIIVFYVATFSNTSVGRLDRKDYVASCINLLIKNRQIMAFMCDTLRDIPNYCGVIKQIYNQYQKYLK